LTLEGANEKALARRDFLDGRTPIQALYEEISAGEFIYDYKADADGSLSALFFSHVSSAKLAETFNTVFVMDLHL
jgi:hypothetical protein